MYGSSSSLRQVLRRSRLFARLGDSEIDAILAHATVARQAEGDHIFAKGDPGNSMMAVLRGRVMISSPSPDGRQVVLTVMREGDVFGEIALLDGNERTADATAMVDCELLVVPRRSLLALLERRPDLCIDLLIVLCERLRRTNEQVEDLAFLDLEARIAKVLVRLAEENGEGQCEQHDANPVWTVCLDLTSGDAPEFFTLFCYRFANNLAEKEHNPYEDAENA